ncbi:Lsr2 family DNA-binding protein [Kineosporia babensis]|uniref:Lsr2 family protein n=1 Tax=Kineosporia babensis TaxID=499548 RepID=A0A9X1NJJ4_9ACTN|nr:Lsr2 family protein [Kineosporia babensis]
MQAVEVAVVTTDFAGRILDEWQAGLEPGLIERLNERLAGAVVVAHNAEFDLARLSTEYRRAGWQLPQLPMLSLVEAAGRQRPELPRRRPDDLCLAFGLTPALSTSTLDQARASAGVLARIIGPDLTAVLETLQERAREVTWPVGPTVDPAAPDTNTDAEDLTVAVSPALVERFSLLDALDEGAGIGTLAYLEELAETIEDAPVAARQISLLARVAFAEERTSIDISRANEAFVRTLTYAALDAEGAVAYDERAGLFDLARLLGVAAQVVLGIDDESGKAYEARLSTRPKGLPVKWSGGEPLRVGDKVVFTGCDPAVREQLENRSLRLGVRILDTVSETTTLLVSDETAHGSRAARARELGTRTVTPADYAYLLKHLQPSARWASQEDAANPEGSENQEPTSAETPEPEPEPTPTPKPRTAQVRAWARANGHPVSARGALPKQVIVAYLAAQDEALNRPDPAADQPDVAPLPTVEPLAQAEAQPST